MISRFKQYRKHGQRVYVCRVTENDQVVREGLAYTPSDMARLTERGMPVNSLMTGKVFYDGEENPSFNVTSDRARHVDICDLWEQHQCLVDKARSAARAKKLNSKSE